MNSKITKAVIVPALFAALLLVTAGCGTPKQKPVAWTIKVTKPASIEVDVVLVTTREKPRLENYSMDKYWSPGDLERKNAVKTNSPPQSATWVIGRKDTIWKKWLGRNSTGFYVIANLPGNFEAGPEGRREYLTLDKNHWDTKVKGTLEIEVQENKVLVLTPEVP